MFRKNRSKRPRTKRPAPGRVGSEAGRAKTRLVLKSVLVGALAVDAVLVLCMIYMLLGRIPYFNLQHVEVTGNKGISQAELIEAADVKLGMNLLLIDLDEISARVRKHPRVRSASVFRRLPGRLSIELEERIPRAVLAAGRLYYVDENGEIISRLTPGDSVKYPLFTGIKPHELKSRGSRVKEMLRSGLKVLDLVEQSDFGLETASIAEIHLDMDYGLTVQTRSGRTVILGKNGFDQKIRRFGRLKEFLTGRGKWGAAGRIDLDFDDRALVGRGAT